MTVSATTTFVTYTGTGANTALSVTFTFQDNADIVVTRRVTATGATSTMALGTDYTVTGGSGSTGTVTPTAGATTFPTTVTWTIKRATAKTQSTDFINGDGLDSNTIEDAFDRGMRIHQESDEILDRALRFPDGEETLTSELPSAVDRALKILTFDVSGNVSAAAASTISPTTVTVGAAGQTLLPLATLANWRTTLDVLQGTGTLEIISSGTEASRPTASLLGGVGFYVASDTGRIFFTPDELSYTEMGIRQVASGSVPAAATSGILVLDTDNLILKRDDGSTVSDLRAPLPYGHIGGLSVSIPSAANLQINPGEARAGTSSNRSLINAFVTSAITKNLGATWANGTGNGGRASGVAHTADTWYHVFLLVNPDGTVDAGFDTSVEAANLLADAAVITAGYTRYRRIASVTTQAAATDLEDFTQLGDLFQWDTLPAVQSQTSVDLTGSDNTHTIKHVPPGIRTEATIHTSMANNSNTTTIRGGDGTIGGDPSNTASPLRTYNGASEFHGIFRLMTDTAQRIKIRVETDTSVDFYTQVESYSDPRGRWD